MNINGLKHEIIKKKPYMRRDRRWISESLKAIMLLPLHINIKQGVNHGIGTNYKAIFIYPAEGPPFYK